MEGAGKDVKELKVLIPLKIVSNAVQRTLPTTIGNVVQSEFASRYLESIGVNANKEAVDYLVTCMPMKVFECNYNLNI